MLYEEGLGDPDWEENVSRVVKLRQILGLSLFSFNLHELKEKMSGDKTKYDHNLVL